MLQGCKAIICMPIVSPDIKVRAVQRLGGTVELVGESYTETQAYAQVVFKRQLLRSLHDLNLHLVKPLVLQSSQHFPNQSIQIGGPKNGRLVQPTCGVKWENLLLI